MPARFATLPLVLALVFCQSIWAEENMARRRLAEAAARELLELNKEIIGKLGGLANIEGKTVLLKAKVLETPDGDKVQVVDAAIWDGRTEGALEPQPGFVVLKGRLKKAGDERFSLDMKDVFPTEAGKPDDKGE